MDVLGFNHRWLDLRASHSPVYGSLLESPIETTELGRSIVMCAGLRECFALVCR